MRALVITHEILPVTMSDWNDLREFIGFELLLFWRFRIIRGPLFQRDIFTDKSKKITILFVKVLNHTN
jgi:hypothetical protein